MKYKMVIFDLDGTILDTLGDLNEACNYALAKYDLNLVDIATTKKFIGHGIRNLIYESSNHSPYIDDLLKEFKEYYNSHFNDYTIPYEGIYEVLNFCKDNGIIIGVYSNKVEDIVNKLCIEHFKGYFNFAYGEVNNRKRKPDPSFLLEIINNHILMRSEVLYIGDSEVDIETCANASVDGLFVSYGFRTKESLTKLSSNVVDKPKDIINHLKY